MQLSVIYGLSLVTQSDTQHTYILLSYIVTYKVQLFAINLYIDIRYEHCVRL